MITKQELRKRIHEQRSELDPNWIRGASQSIVDKLEELDEFKSAECVALYKAIAGEINVDRLFSSCWSLHKRCCIPVYNSNAKIYEFAEIDINTSFRTGNYGIQEPEAPTLVPVEEIDLMIVPGVAFDPSGNRLGRGGGYYDRLLSRFAGNSVAVAFDFQVFPRIPCDSHDIPVNAVVTEAKTIKVGNEH